MSTLKPVPLGWSEQPISDVAPFQRGFDLPARAIRLGNYPIVYSNGIGGYHSVAMVAGPGVVTGRSGTLGQIFYIEDDFWPHNTSLWVTSFKGNDAKFISYLYKMIGFERFASGSGVPTLNRNDAHSFFVRVPNNPDEQKAIAQALSDMDGLIASLDALMAKKRAIKQGAMQQLLTGKRRLPGFSGEWEPVNLGSLCVMKSGAGITSRTITETGRFPVYGANGLRGFTTCKTHSGVFPLIGRVGALCGNIQVARGDFFASEHAIVAEPKGKTNPEWLALALGRLGLNRLSEASAQPVLTVGKLAILQISAPTDPLEQQAISDVILAMQGELDQIGARLSKLKEVRQGMMQQLLTGRIRLI